MLKSILSLLIFLFVIGNISAQPFPRRDTTGLKLIKTYNGNKLCGIDEYDRQGNCVFSKSDGMSGPVIMADSYTYDSLHRVTVDISTHSNLGFYISERVYEPSCTKEYVYMLEDEYSESGFYFGHEAHDLLVKINTKSALDNCEKVLRLKKGKKFIMHVTLYDSRKNVIKEVSLDPKGDTTGIQLHTYNEKNVETYFHYESRAGWKSEWDYYAKMDERGNRIQWSRVENLRGKLDTTEITKYTYSPTDKPLSYTYTSHTGYFYQIVYEYDANDKLIKEMYYDKDPGNLTRTVTYKYDANGKPKKEKANDPETLPMNPEFKYHFKREYWKK